MISRGCEKDLGGLVITQARRIVYDNKDIGYLRSPSFLYQRYLLNVQLDHHTISLQLVSTTCNCHWVFLELVDVAGQKGLGLASKLQGMGPFYRQVGFYLCLIET